MDVTVTGSVFRVMAPVAELRPGQRLQPNTEPLRLELSPEQMALLVDMLKPNSIKALMLVLQEATVFDGPAGRWVGVGYWGRGWLMRHGMREHRARVAAAELVGKGFIVPVDMPGVERTGNESNLIGPQLGVLGEIVGVGASITPEMVWRGHRKSPGTPRVGENHPHEEGPRTGVNHPHDGGPRVGENHPHEESERSSRESPLGRLVAHTSNHPVSRDVEEEETLLTLDGKEIRVEPFGERFGTEEVRDRLAQTTVRTNLVSVFSRLDHQRVAAHLGHSDADPKWLADLLVGLLDKPASQSRPMVDQVFAGWQVSLRKEFTDARLVGGLWVVFTALAHRVKPLDSLANWVASLMLKDTLQVNAGVLAAAALMSGEDIASPMGTLLTAVRTVPATVGEQEICVFDAELEAALVNSEFDSMEDRRNVAKNTNLQARLRENYRNTQRRQASGD